MIRGVEIETDFEPTNAGKLYISTIIEPHRYEPFKIIDGKCSEDILSWNGGFVQCMCG